MGRLGPSAFFFYRGMRRIRRSRSGQPARAELRLKTDVTVTLQLGISRGADFFTVHKVLE